MRTPIAGSGDRGAVAACRSGGRSYSWPRRPPGCIGLPRLAGLHEAWRRLSSGNPGLAVAAVLGYRAFEYWLPVVPGVLAYVRLLRAVGEWDDSEITQSM